MSDVEFEEEDTLLAQIPKQAERIPTFGKILLKTGLAKNSSQINTMLVVISLIIFAIAFFVFFNFT